MKSFNKFLIILGLLTLLLISSISIFVTKGIPLTHDISVKTTRVCYGTWISSDGLKLYISESKVYMYVGKKYINYEVGYWTNDDNLKLEPENGSYNLHYNRGSKLGRFDCNSGKLELYNVGVDFNEQMEWQDYENTCLRVN